jgi:galactokinase
LASAKLATSLFTASFGSRPAVVTSAPGTIDLMGGHTEHEGGPVLSIAIERRIAVAAGLAPRWSIVSTLGDQVPQRDRLESVVQELGAIGVAPPGANLAIAGSLSAEGEPSAAAALAVALAKALGLLAGRRLTPAELAAAAARAELGRTGAQAMRPGPIIATHAERGMALLLECTTGRIRPLAFPGRLWVLETGAGRQSSEDWRGARERECDDALACCREWRPGLAHLAQLSLIDLEELQWRLPASWVPRVRHVVTETERTRWAAAALARGDLQRFGQLMVEAHGSLRRDYESASLEADVLVDSAVSHGASGARLTGVSSGAAVIMLVAPEDEARILAQVSQDFQDRFGRVLQAWSTRAAAGVRRETVKQ